MRLLIAKFSRNRWKILSPVSVTAPIIVPSWIAYSSIQKASPILYLKRSTKCAILMCRPNAVVLSFHSRIAALNYSDALVHFFNNFQKTPGLFLLMMEVIYGSMMMINSKDFLTEGWFKFFDTHLIVASPLLEILELNGVGNKDMISLL